MSTSVLADVTQSDVDKAKNSLKEVQKDISENKNQQSTTLNQIDKINTNIGTLEEQIDTIATTIKELKEKTVITEENIDFMQLQYDNKLETRKQRAVAYYKYNVSSLESVIASTEDPSERMYLQRAVEKITEYEEKLLAETEAEKEQLMEEKNRLIEDSLTCAELQEELEVKLNSLDDQKVELITKYAALKEEQSELEAKEHDLEEEAKKLEEELKRIASSSKNSVYNGGKMTWPIPGAYYITANFGKYPSSSKRHTGVDIARAGGNTKGMAVVAAADGTVIKVVEKYAEKVPANGYGAYVVIDHGGGVQTLYAHSSKVEVKVGDKVKAGQEIMKAGTSGNSSGPHLHFEVRIDGTCVNPFNGWISKG